MIFINIPYFKENGIYFTLNEILSAIPESPPIWNFLYFNGTGVLSNNNSIIEFEEMINSSSSGYIIEWNELKKISEMFYQVYDCLIVGGKNLESITGNKTSKENFTLSSIVIEIFDSTEVSIGFDNENQLSIFKKNLLLK
mgnify:CR=1 FL=1|jgi:hypothetical protein